jgi:thiamine kinase-like enzyme
VWRLGEAWTPGLIVGHNDAAPYNAVWRDDTLAGFIDWDFAAPVTREWDLAFVAFSWVPLHARAVVIAEGFSDFASRPARLRRLLQRYGWEGDSREFIGVVQDRARANADGIRRLARDGDPLFARLLAEGAAASLDTAAVEVADFDF